MDLSLNFLNRNKPPKESNSSSVGEWKDSKVTSHHPPEDISTTDLLSNSSDFTCMYCLNIDGYLDFLKEVRAHTRRPMKIIKTPHFINWVSFKQHMYTAHAEQWSYGLVPDAYAEIRLSKTSWSKRDKQDAASLYIYTRANIEYGWNFFVVVNEEVQRTLHALPKDESKITSVLWYPRINTDTNRPWTDWRCEKEGETHKRAQNGLPSKIGRTHASILPILRGMRSSEGCVLERNPKRLTKYAHLPAHVNMTCILTDDALKQVQDIRNRLNLSGPGNISILKLHAGEHHETKQEVKEKEVVEKQVLKEQIDIEGPSINVQDVAIKLEQLLPKNDFTTTLMNQINVIFDYVREQSQHEEDFYRVQADLDLAKNELKEVRADAAKESVESQTMIDRLQNEIINLKSVPKKSVIKQIEEESEKTKESIRRLTNRPRFI
jgi:hypothetical protein